MSTPIQPPWKQSKKGSVYCIWGSIPADIKSQLKQEDRFEITLEEYHYTVKRNEDGAYIVFRSTKDEYESGKTQHYFKRPIYRMAEVEVLPIEDANKLLRANNQYELVGTDPIKVVKDQFFAIVGKKEKITI
jgi:hypothetical protein